MLSEGEKKAIELLEDIKNNSWTTKYIMSSDSKNADILLNLITKLQKEIEKKNKVIDLIAKMINTHDIYDDICGQFGKNKDCSDFTNEELCIDCIKQYFYRKVEEEIK